jgi:hypothetical protein
MSQTTTIHAIVCLGFLCKEGEELANDSVYSASGTMPTVQQ